ncbi:MAG: sulfatase-like hydrolase/transferase, partial [Pseudomonadales bacterium]|nr:sulfatase-like hydrolase/transferase [Pseudomonadales bacterium]
IAPHTPLDAPQELQDKYADINTDLAPARSKQTDRTRRISKMTMQKSARPMFAAVVDGMDQAIGQVLDTLDSEGIAENTIVVFFSDNGGAAYSVGGADNAPLRGGKGEAFEGGIRVVSVIRWPAALAGGQRMEQIMTVMDLFPTLADAAGIKPQNKRKLDGRSMWPAIQKGKRQPRKELVYFTSETPIRGQIALTAFNDEWKLVQEIEQDQLSVDVTNFLFNINEDPYEYNNLAQAHPEVVRKLADKIHSWRALYPISGTRSQLAPPPGWRAPLDWASYPIAIDKLQEKPARGMAPTRAIKRLLDMQHGERGRLMYDCTPKWWLGGFCKDGS